MPTINQTVKRPGHYLVREDETFSRENVVVSGGNYVAGTVLGQVTATGKFVQVNAAAADGSENAKAILFDNVDASTEDQIRAVHDYHAVVRKDSLAWPNGATQGEIDAWLDQLKTQHIKAR